MPTGRDECEQAFGRLIGESLAAAVYMGAWTTAPSEPGAYVEWVELSTQRDVRFRITTEPDFGDHGLAILEGAVDRSDALKVVDATALSPWRRVIGKRIARARVLWRALVTAAGAAPGEAPEYPRDVVLTFENGELVVLSAASVGQNGDIVLGVDSVGAFDEREARALGILEQRS